MDKFWEWMERKGHTGSERWLRKECADEQMLIGYMIEYLMENDIKISDAIPFRLENILSIDGVYNWLKAAVENI